MPAPSPQGNGHLPEHTPVLEPAPPTPQPGPSPTDLRPPPPPSPENTASVPTLHNGGQALREPHGNRAAPLPPHLQAGLRNPHLFSKRLDSRVSPEGQPLGPTPSPGGGAVATVGVGPGPSQGHHPAWSGGPARAPCPTTALTALCRHLHPHTPTGSPGVWKHPCFLQGSLGAGREEEGGSQPKTRVWSLPALAPLVSPFPPRASVSPSGQ